MSGAAGGVSLTSSEGCCHADIASERSSALIELFVSWGMLMRVYKAARTGRGYVDDFFRGQRYRYKGGSSRRAAEHLRLRVEREINSGKHNPLPCATRCAGAAKVRRRSVSWLRRFWGRTDREAGLVFITVARRSGSPTSAGTLPSRRSARSRSSASWSALPATSVARRVDN